MAPERALDSLDFAAIVRPGDTVMCGQSSAEPVPLVQTLMQQRHRIGRFNMFLGTSYSGAATPEHADCVRFCSYGGGGTNRALAKAGKLDILPVHYSQLAARIASGAFKVDVLLLQLSPADPQGHYSLSMAHEYLVPALDAARVVIAEVNDQAPWTYGERYLTDDDIDCIVPTSRAPFELAHPAPGDTEQAIARHVAGLIEDGATLQLGIGALPEALLAALADRRDLGLHTGAIGDAAADLMQAGVITNAWKTIDRGVAVAGVMFGGRRIQRFCHRNAAVQFRSAAYTHDAERLARMDRLVALNTAIEVDLTGQVNTEVAGGVYVGAVGGALDFLRGAQRAKGGLPIIALPSTAKGASRIVSRLQGPATIPRSDGIIVVSEYGVADLRGASLAERARRLIAIAHPQFREDLEREARLLPR